MKGFPTPKGRVTEVLFFTKFEVLGVLLKHYQVFGISYQTINK